MAEVYPSFFDRVRYRLQHPIMGTATIKEPEGWNDDEKEFARVKNYAGIFTRFSNNLKFVDNGASYIELVKDLYGVNAEIRLTKQVRNPDTDSWENSYTGVLDLSTYVKQDRKVKCKFNASGLEQQIKSREKERLEIERVKTMDGVEIDPIETEQLFLEGRRIFLKSSFDVSPTNNETHTQVASNAGSTFHQTAGCPVRIKTNSHQGLLNTVLPQAIGTETQGELGMMFFFDADRDRTISIDIDLSLDAFFQQYENVQWCFYKISLVTYENGFDFDVKNRITLAELNSGLPSGDPYDLPANVDYAFPQFTIPMTAQYSNANFQILEGESLAIELYLKADMYVDNNAGVRCFAQNITGNFNAGPSEEPIIIKLDEDSVYPSSYTKTILAHEFGEKLVEIMTGRDDAFYSEALGRTDIGYDQDGFGAYTGFSHGFWIRRFDALPNNDENKYKGLTVSFKDWLEFLKTTLGLDMGIEPLGFKERIIIEPWGYFFNQNVTIRLPIQVKNVKRSVAKDYYYSGIEIGYAKGGEYEEAMGLDEYNAKSTFTTVITRIDRIFKRVSKIRTDSYGAEFARRKPISDFPTEDTSYDQDVWAFDMKRMGNDFELRKWQDDFAEQPENVFSPETATNLRFSPFNIMFYKQGAQIASALLSYPTDYVRYGSSTANSRLKTRIIGGVAYSENEEQILNNDFQKAKFVPEWIEFEHVVDHSLMKHIQDSTIILGKKVPNFYGLVEFTNENGGTERGFLFNLKPNKEGKWKLLKHNR